MTLKLKTLTALYTIPGIAIGTLVFVIWPLAQIVANPNTSPMTGLAVSFATVYAAIALLIFPAANLSILWVNKEQPPHITLLRLQVIISTALSPISLVVLVVVIITNIRRLRITG